MLTPTPKKRAFSSRLRAAIFILHLWMGLSCGALFSLVCASGCFLALHPVVEAWANRGLLHCQTNSNRAPVQPMLAAASATTSAIFRELEIPAAADSSWIVRLEDNSPSLYLDPFSGEVLGRLDPGWGKSFEVVEHLHRWLLLDQKVGRPITGAAALVYLSLMLSGALLWLSKCFRNPKRGLAFRRGVGWKRLAYDAHLILGIYAIVPLFLMASTGLYWSYRQPYKSLAYRVLDGTPAPVPPASSKDEAPRPRRLDLPYEAILATIASEQPAPGLVKIAFPKEGETEVKVSKIRTAGFWCLPIKDDWMFDALSGQAVRRQPFASKTRAERFLSLIFEIHSGGAWGNVTLGLWVAAVLLGLTLPITGTVMWANRMRGQYRTRRNRGDGGEKPRLARRESKRGLGATADA